MSHETKVPTFYELGFAGQMLVWAARKRLHSFATGADDSNAIEAFRAGNLEELHSALMSVIDVLACGASKQLQLHAVSCPCLSPHEVTLLDALAHLQEEREELAYTRITALLGSVVARVVWPALCAIVNELDARELRIWPIHAAPPPRPAPWDARAHATVH